MKFPSRWPHTTGVGNSYCKTKGSASARLDTELPPRATMLRRAATLCASSRHASHAPRPLFVSRNALHEPRPALWVSQRLLSTGRSLADDLSDQLAKANILLADLIDDDDRISDDFKDDLEEMRTAYADIRTAYETAIASLPDETEQTKLKKNFELAVVGMRDKLSALEEEVGN